MHSEHSEPRPPLLPILKRGLRGRCPHCGEGRMFRKFLKVADACPACGEELNHHRADDAPAYLVIVILGHILVPVVVWVELAYSPPYWVQAALWTPLALLLAVGMLQPLKGAVIAMEWRMGQHGFAASKARRHARTLAERQNPLA